MHETRKKPRTRWSVFLVAELSEKVELYRKLESARYGITLSRNQFIGSLLRRAIESLEIENDERSQTGE